MTYDYDLGNYRRDVSTTSPEAQEWFDRGLSWTYGFHHEEAIACFEQAIVADPECAMAWWGIAYALGPNYNKPWEFFDEHELRTTVERTRDALERAQSHATSGTAVEKALVGGARRPLPPHRPAAADFSVWNDVYADAMGTVYREHPDDLDVAALYADALMNLTPWQLWDITRRGAGRGVTHGRGEGGPRAGDDR